MMKYNAKGIGELDITDGGIGVKKGMVINMFHRQYEVDILFYTDKTKDGDILPIEEPVIEVYHDFFKHIDDRIKEAENAILEYYKSEVKEQFEDGLYDQYVEITYPEELAERKQITLKSALFGFYNERKGKVKYGLLFDCDWDVDDGLGIRFDGNIVEIGTSDVVL